MHEFWYSKAAGNAARPLLPSFNSHLHLQRCTHPSFATRLFQEEGKGGEVGQRKQLTDKFGGVGGSSGDALPLQQSPVFQNYLFHLAQTSTNYVSGIWP